MRPPADLDGQGRPADAGPLQPGPPDYIGVGAQWCGVPWWHGLLVEHPQISRPLGTTEEGGFFDDFCVRELTDADIARYHQRFARPAGTCAGEWRTRYLYDAWTPPLLARAAPDAKLLVLLRDPIARYGTVLRARLGEAVDPDEVIYMSDAVHRGRYASQLRALYEFFPPEQVLVQQVERCRQDVVGEYRRTIAFLGLDEGFTPRHVRFAARGESGSSGLVRAARALGVPEHVNRRWLRASAKRILRGEGSRPRATMWPELEESLRIALRDEVRDLVELVPGFDPSLWRSFAGDAD